MNITVSCEDSDGYKMSDSAPIKGDYWFTVTFNPGGATGTPTTPR
jgi:hypothetical protein